MNQPSPTPYDIISPTRVPYVFPENVLLIIGSVACLLIIVALVYKYVSSKKMAYKNIQQQVLHELQAVCSQDKISEKDINRMRLLLLRYLSFIEGNSEVLSYASSQLRSLQKNSSNKLTVFIAETLIEIENERFAIESSYENVRNNFDHIVQEFK